MRPEDRIKETTTTTGTGDITLAGAATGYQTFTSRYAIGERFYYVIAGGAEWEVGSGSLSGTTTLVRERVLRSSNSDAAVTFSAGSKDVFSDWAAISFFELFQQQFAAWRPPISW